MGRLLAVSSLLSALRLAEAQPPAGLSSIKHVVIVMLENHAFDNMAGLIPGVNGPSAKECNIMDGVSYCNNDRGAWSDPDPDHSVPATAWQIYGENGLTPANEHNPSAVTMSGFVSNYAHVEGGNSTIGGNIMASLTPAHVPIISTLASSFAIFDAYHASVPGPTFPNRLFALSGTSHGYGDNDDVMTVLGWPQRSIFGALSATPGLVDPWRVYFTDVPSALLLDDARNLTDLHRYKFLDTWATDCANGDLASVSWVEPGFIDIPGQPASDEHPAHDVRDGERFLKAIYEPLRASPLWDETLLLITYDEHGGFWDHVPPPVVGVPSPDGRPCVDCGGTPFNFTRLGVRVPMIAVSAYTPAGTVISAPPSNAFDHGSIAATLQAIFPSFPGPLTARDAWSAPLTAALSLSDPRTDAPTTLPAVPAGPSPALVGVPRDGRGPVNDLQRSLLLLVAGAAAEASGADTSTAAILAELGRAGALESEAAAGLYARASMAARLARK